MEYPKRLVELDRRALMFWHRLSPAERLASDMGAPMGPYQRLARVLGVPTDAEPATVDVALKEWQLLPKSRR